jgi:cell wall assembly regulator SMI1
MAKKIMMVLAAIVAAGAAQAGTYNVLQDSDCKLISRGELSLAVQKAGTDTGLNLPKDMAVRTEVHCAQDVNSKRFVYTIRAAIEKLVSDGEQQRWTVVAQNTGYGTTAGSAALLREVRFTVRDVIRQEP